MQLTNIDMPATTIGGQLVQRRLLAEAISFAEFDYQAGRILLDAPIFYYVPTPRAATQQQVDDQGNVLSSTQTSQTDNVPFTSPAFKGDNGLLIHQIPVTNDHLVDARTGSNLAPDTPTMYRIGEFNFLRGLLNNKVMTLEECIMSYLSRFVAQGTFDTTFYATL